MAWSEQTVERIYFKEWTVLGHIATAISFYGDWHPVNRRHYYIILFLGNEETAFVYFQVVC